MSSAESRATEATATGGGGIEARSVLLTALNQQATTVEDWRCVTT